MLAGIVGFVVVFIEMDACRLGVRRPAVSRHGIPGSRRPPRSGNPAVARPARSRLPCRRPARSGSMPSGSASTGTDRKTARVATRAVSEPADGSVRAKAEIWPLATQRRNRSHASQAAGQLAVLLLGPAAGFLPAGQRFLEAGSSLRSGRSSCRRGRPAVQASTKRWARALSTGLAEHGFFRRCCSA